MKIDFMSVGGYILGPFVIGWIMWKGDMMEFIFNFQAFVLIAGGTLASLMISYPWSAFQWIPAAMMFILFALNVPVAFAIGIAALSFFLLAQGVQIETFIQRLDVLSSYIAAEE